MKELDFCSSFILIMLITYLLSIYLLIIVEKLRIKFLQMFYSHEYFNTSYK